jgi:DNA-binding protein H-NS
MNTSYKDLLKQREALEQQINEARRRELSAAVAQVRDLIAEYGLSHGPQRPRVVVQRYQGGAQIPQSRHGPDLDGAWQGTQVDSERGPREVRHLNRRYPLIRKARFQRAFLLAARSGEHPSPVMAIAGRAALRHASFTPL